MRGANLKSSDVFSALLFLGFGVGRAKPIWRQKHNEYTATPWPLINTYMPQQQTSSVPLRMQLARQYLRTTAALPGLAALHKANSGS
jgi:hypothetical protein